MKELNFSGFHRFSINHFSLLISIHESCFCSYLVIAQVFPTLRMNSLNCERFLPSKISLFVVAIMQLLSAIAMLPIVSISAWGCIEGFDTTEIACVRFQNQFDFQLISVISKLHEQKSINCMHNSYTSQNNG